MADSTPPLDTLIQQLNTGSTKKQLAAIDALIAQGETGYSCLFTYLKENLPQEQKPVLAVGATYQALRNTQTPETIAELERNYPNGIFPLESAAQINYQPLQTALAAQDFETSDNLTREMLCELAGDGAVQRQWLYFTEVEKFPSLDLHTINSLWWLHSNGNFGFSVQRQLWKAVGKDFPKLWPKIGWKTGNTWTRWPSGFTWNLSAPVGHLPLLNQLRGVRVAESLYNHPVWERFQW